MGVPRPRPSPRRTLSSGKEIPKYGDYHASWRDCFNLLVANYSQVIGAQVQTSPDVTNALDPCTDRASIIKDKVAAHPMASVHDPRARKWPGKAACGH